MTPDTFQIIRKPSDTEIMNARIGIYLTVFDIKVPIFTIKELDINLEKACAKRKRYLPLLRKKERPKVAYLQECSKSQSRPPCNYV